MTRIPQVFATLFLAAPAWGGELELVASRDSNTPMPLISIYGEADPSVPPLTATEVAGTVSYEGDGPVWLGLNGLPGRIGPFDDGDSVRFGDVSLSVPMEAIARFGVLTSDGGLIGVIDAGSTVALPEGSYDLRRDLGDETIAVDISSRQARDIDFGVLRIDWGGDPKSQIYIADPATLQVRATVVGGAPVALPEGRYLAATGTNGLLTEFDVISGAVTEARALMVRIESLLDQQIEITAGERRATIGTYDTATLIVQDGTGLSQAVLGDLDAAAGVQEVVWLNADGTFPRLTGLALTLAEGGDRFIAGGVTEVGVELPAPASVSAVITQDTVSATTEFENLSGQAVLAIDVPAGLTSDPVTLRVTATRLSDGRALVGEIADIPVHLPPGDLISGVDVDEVTATTVSLSWKLEQQASVNIYRNRFESPLNGQSPVAGREFQDIGLSAGRAYTYRLCPVDDLGLEGTCQSVRVSTARRN
ncbi:MAG: hypothetical protein ACSHW1_16635 [Yoonia sp.]|uniref:hypothetical protein n=1 Tax=Yoonia sp. TaxID=2212373 RepID=UPI003EF50503